MTTDTLDRVEDRTAKRQQRLAQIKYPKYFHRAVRVRDMEATRHFYEDIVGLPFVGCGNYTKDHATGGDTNYIHTFFGLGDGSYLAFFQFSDDRYPYVERTGSYMDHHAIAAKDEKTVLEFGERCKKAGVVHFVVDDPVCLSVYAVDGDFFEAACSRPGCIEEFEQDNAHQLLADWLAKYGRDQKVIPRATA